MTRTVTKSNTKNANTISGNKRNEVQEGGKKGE